MEDDDRKEDKEASLSMQWLCGGGHTNSGASNPFHEQTPKYKQHLRHKVLGQLEDMLKDIQFHRHVDVAELLDYLSRSMTGESKETVDCITALQSQISSLPTLGDRSDVIRLLTHQNGSLNTDVLAFLPDFAARSATLLASSGKTRKRRSDYMYTEFVSDYIQHILLIFRNNYALISYNIWYDIDRLNTFGNKIRVGTSEDGSPIHHCPHELNDTLKNVFLQDFLYSPEYEDWHKISGTTMEYSKFAEGATMCPCTMKPQFRYCVDEIETGELLYSLKKKLRSNVKCECDFCAEEATRTKKTEQGPGK
jgi:hypothetical protein